MIIASGVTIPHQLCLSKNFLKKNFPKRNLSYKKKTFLKETFRIGQQEGGMSYQIAEN